MKKLFTLLALAVLALPLAAAAPANDIFTRALKDEMQRTQKQLRTAGSPAPFFIGYELLENTEISAAAQFGETISFPREETSVLASALMSVGNRRTDNWGLDNNRVVAYETNVPRSYYGIRQTLWDLSDMAYAKAIQLYDAKQAFKRNKNISSDLPDFLPAPKVVVRRELSVPELAQAGEIEKLARELSDWGKDKKFVENFNVQITHSHNNMYYLNSEGSAYQDSLSKVVLVWRAHIRNNAGFLQVFSQEESFLRLDEQTLKEIHTLSERFRSDLEHAFTAKKADESYVGPVLLEPDGAAWMLRQVFLKNITNLKPLLDTTFQVGGDFRDKQGKRIMSNLITIYDKPQANHYKNKPLAFRGVFDDEGVVAQELTLAQGGKLKDLPRSRRPLDKKAQSNGHGFSPMATLSFPREATTNVWVEAVRPQTPQQLEEQLLAKCRDMELEYCYIIKSLPVPIAQRIYTADGHKENIFGLKLSGLTPRALRDIIGAGNNYEVADNNRMVTPSLLLEELELVPDTEEPEKPPFVPKP